MPLQEVRDLRRLWISPLECPSGLPLHDFVEIADPRWVFPLIELGVGVKDRLLSAEDELLDLAVSRIRMIDYKTVSIVGFEHTLLGCYREQDHVVHGS